MNIVESLFAIPMKAIVTSYRNPDTDGFASAIGYCHFLSHYHQFEDVGVRFSGGLDAETVFAAESFPGAEYEMLPNSLDAEVVYLVDTHHLAQIGGIVRPSSVRGVIDHHPNGDAAAFPNATIINENVGAAATIVAEMLRNLKIEVPTHIAGLLLAGIISNTLGFRSPTTSSRDRDMAKWLRGICGAGADFPEKLLMHRNAAPLKSTSELLSIDCKMFTFGARSAALSQLETTADQATAVARRPDLLPELEKLAAARHADIVMFNAVNITDQKTFIATPDHRLQGWLESNGIPPFRDGISIIDRIFIRKSDIVPLLNRFFTERDGSAIA